MNMWPAKSFFLNRNWLSHLLAQDGSPENSSAGKPAERGFLLCVFPKISPICCHAAPLTLPREHSCRTMGSEDAAVGVPTRLTSTGVYIDKPRCHKSGSKKRDR